MQRGKTIVRAIRAQPGSRAGQLKVHRSASGGEAPVVEHVHAEAGDKGSESIVLGREIRRTDPRVRFHAALHESDAKLSPVAELDATVEAYGVVGDPILRPEGVLSGVPEPSEIAGPRRDKEPSTSTDGLVQLGEQLARASGLYLGAQLASGRVQVRQRVAREEGVARVAAEVVLECEGEAQVVRPPRFVRHLDDEPVPAGLLDQTIVDFGERSETVDSR